MPKHFIPKKVFFESEALDYPLGRQLHRKLTDMGVPIELITSHNRITIKATSPKEKYILAKSYLAVGVRRTLKFAGCKPSAHYQLPLVTSCPGLCEYCYLQTTLGPQPINRVYVNLEEILATAKQHIEERKPKITKFEGSATSDPVPVEYLSGSLAHTISFFAQEPYGRFRFVTKFADIDSLLTIEHNGHTEIRFSLNTDPVINQYEKGTDSLEDRLQAAAKVAAAGYPIGFLIAPIIIYDEWQADYHHLIIKMAQTLPQNIHLSIELITHRFTTRAKHNIAKVFPNSTLPLDEKERKYKYGQFGYGKYIYPDELMAQVNEFFTQELATYLPQAEVIYLV